MELMRGVKEAEFSAVFRKEAWLRYFLENQFSLSE